MALNSLKRLLTGDWHKLIVFTFGEEQNGERNCRLRNVPTVLFSANRVRRSYICVFTGLQEVYILWKEAVNDIFKPRWSSSVNWNRWTIACAFSRSWQWKHYCASILILPVWAHDPISESFWDLSLLTEYCLAVYKYSVIIVLLFSISR